MTELEKAARLALKRLETAQENADGSDLIESRDIAEIEIAGDLWPETVALRAALAQQQDEPFAYCYVHTETSADAFTFDPDPTDAVPLTVFPLYAALAQQAEPVSALTRYNEIAKDSETYTGHALERLRIFCSLAMTEEDWLDVEPFFDDAEQELAKLEQQAEPVAVPPKSFRVGYMTGYADGQRELRKKQHAEPVTEPVVLTHDEVQRLAAQAGLPLAWISERGVIQWSQLERLIALARQQAEPVVDAAQCDGGSCGVGGYCKTCPKQQAEPVQEPAIPWGKAIGAGCRVCGLGADGRAMGYVCPRGDCPTQVRSGTHEQS